MEQIKQIKEILKANCNSLEAEKIEYLIEDIITIKDNEKKGAIKLERIKHVVYFVIGSWVCHLIMSIVA
jgi:hypothetical protein